MKSGLKNIVTALKKIAINRLLYKSYEKKGNKISLQILVLDLKSEVWQFVFFLTRRVSPSGFHFTK